MNFDQYQTNAIRTAKMFPDVASNLSHAALGLATESGEFITEVKRVSIYNKPLTDEMRQHMAEELGDLMWYIALAAQHLGISMNEMAEANIDKLRLRFPEKYSDQAAEQRADKNGVDARNS